MISPQQFEQIVSGAASGGWDWFKSADPAVQQALDVNQAKEGEDNRAIASAWARFAASPDGRKALERLFDTTLRRTVFFVSLGLDSMSMATFGAFREGQNALAHEIARQIARGNNEAAQPRET
ncbi:hypothetical protein [Shinella zoogloeoides]|uniref:hypothetical protein n=1 Tax=Shinella zoogloeoides TaxID=352475 RepID=UPI0028B05178|nr:hypothetical protein [Shinella zoogloeoides]